MRGNTDSASLSDVVYATYRSLLACACMGTDGGASRARGCLDGNQDGIWRFARRTSFQGQAIRAWLCGVHGLAAEFAEVPVQLIKPWESITPEHA